MVIYYTLILRGYQHPVKIALKVEEEKSFRNWLVGITAKDDSLSNYSDYMIRRSDVLLFGFDVK